MADRKAAIDAFIARLTAHNARLMGLEIGDPMDAGTPDLLATIGIAKAPPELIELYLDADGAALMWNVKDDVGELAGGFNFQSYGVAMARNSGEGGEEPLQNILWTGDESPNALAILKQMVVFDSVPGRNDFVGFQIDDPSKLYLIEDGKPRAIHATLAQVLDAIVAFGGADSLREHLTHEDWTARIDADSVLQRIKAL